MVAILNLPTTTYARGGPLPVGVDVASLDDGVPPAGTARPATTVRLSHVVAVVLFVVVAGLGLARTAPVDGVPADRTVGTHVVVDGDTMWSIAQAVAPAGEAAGYVERLVAHNGGAGVVPGQVVVLPAP